MKCKTCDKTFIPKQKYCCNACRVKAHRYGIVTPSNESVFKEGRLEPTDWAIDGKEVKEYVREFYKKQQVLNCKKHHGSSNCGCTEDAVN